MRAVAVGGVRFSDRQKIKCFDCVHLWSSSSRRFVAFSGAHPKTIWSSSDVIVFLKCLSYVCKWKKLKILKKKKMFQLTETQALVVSVNRWHQWQYRTPHRHQAPQLCHLYDPGSWWRYGSRTNESNQLRHYDLARQLVQHLIKSEATKLNNIKIYMKLRRKSTVKSGAEHANLVMITKHVG